MAVSPRASFDSSDPPDPERTALLREVLAFDELTSTQRAHMLGHLATELIFERDIEGRAAALAEFRSLTIGAPGTGASAAPQRRLGLGSRSRPA